MEINMTMKKLAAGLLLSVFALSSMAGDFKIGIVDFAKVFESVPQGRSTLDSLKKALEPQLEGLKKKQQDIAEAVKVLRRDSPTMDDATRQKKEQALMDRQQAFEKEVADMREVEMNKEQIAAQAFDERVTAAIQDLAAAEHYDLILNKQVTPFANPSFDLTDRIVEKMKK
jgi:outer membrane protein